ncbi:DNA repair protein SMC6 [Aspergillus novofumigatus IBT 16806]|uniref:Putative DNA repair protein Rad18 n=1 Tax=Aspergillus novofumigatus (strain IBT 16806) TaxID=1392255 RepID=A0A2I1C1Q6_ASPN1|nr:putative DNA repair protein Rad18 [Aspergillus novofumigatus IBT 16806]PKX91567.1 putative DNA repair protein Rad18 [Aspergillus novofumigatus IBT 16806]
MASAKRLQASQDPESFNDEGGGTSLTFTSRKRIRRSETSRSEEDNESSDAETRTSCSITEALDDDEDELELRATQAIQEKYSFANEEPNIPAEHGILERVECYNFMCHDHFRVELGPLINFIVGKNGSGKSAVLTAITLCLGGKASATNRGQSLKSFIKEGKESATIIVRLKNQGDGAYMPDDYGKSIIIERHFSKNGTSGFKVKAENGRIISTKKAELDSIIDYFTLQFDNPMNVLSQDMARQFLSTSSPADKYRFFVKGVQLEQLDQDYRLIEESADQIEEKLRNREQDIRILRDLKDTADRRLEKSDQQESLRSRIRNVRNQVAWAQVEEQEKASHLACRANSLEGELAQTDGEIATAEAQLSVFDVNIQDTERECAAAAEFLNQATSRLDQAKGERNEIKTKLEEQLSERHDLQAEQRQIKEYLRTTETRIRETQNQIADENRRLADLSGGSYSRKEEQVQQAKTEAAEIRRQCAEHQQSARQLYQEAEEAEIAVKLAAAPMEKLKAEVDQAESNLRNLNREGIRRTGFHERMPALLKEVEIERSFSRKPVGPIGSYVSLLKPEWSSILENALGATLNSFIVTSKRDMNILSHIMQRVGCVCPIFIGSDGHIDTSEHEPEPHYDTALRVLQIDNDLVRRQLIINHGIEQMLLIERLEDASSVLFDGPRPKNVKRCYCIDGTDRRRGIHLSYSRTGDPSQAPVQAYNGSPRMKSDLESQIRIQRDVVAGLRRELSNQEQQLRSARSRLESCKQAIERHKRRSKELQVLLQRQEDQLEELTDALERETVEDGHLDVLRTTLQEAEAEKRLNEGSLKDSADAMDAMMRKLKATKQELSAKDAEISTLQEELRVAQGEEHLVQDKRRKIIGLKNTAIERVNDIKLNRTRIQQEKDRVAARVVEYEEKASLVSPRVAIDEGETANTLSKKLERLHGDLQRSNQQLGGSRDEIAAEVERATAAYQGAMKQIEEFRLLADVLKATLRHRKARWLIFRSHISSRAKAQFTYLLSERSFRGRLLTDHNGKLLDLQAGDVEPDITKDSAGRGAKTLSGGEKSFSQVCLLLALWEAMGSPVRCLDEFDVYMDHINRKMAIDMLMLAARRSIGRQFILITPGSRAEITLAPDVRVKEYVSIRKNRVVL